MIGQILPPISNVERGQAMGRSASSQP